MRISGTLVLAIVSAGLTLAVCEGVARWLLPAPRYHRDPVEFDATLGFRGIPNLREELVDETGRYTVEFNPQGLRGRSIPSRAPTPADARRVLFVGDSFLVGRAVREPQLATSVAEASLRARGIRAEVFNLSGIDWGTGQELLALRALGRGLHPEAMVLFLYPANDVINNSLQLAETTAVSPGDPIRPYLVPEDGALRTRYLHPFRALLRRHSRLFALLEQRVLAARIGVVEPKRVAPQSPVPREELEIFRAHDPGHRWELAWETTFALLRSFRDECDAIGARCLVVVVPSVDQVARTARAMRLDAETRASRGQGLDQILDWNLPERRLARFFRNEKIETRFLLSALRDASAAGSEVYARDGHLAVPGHEIAARTAVEWFVDDAHQEPPEVRGGPVRILPDASAAPPWLDFRRERHSAQLGDGWISWRAQESAGAGGWRIGPRAAAVLPARAGDLVLAGWVVPEARLPVLGQVGIVGGPRYPLRIDRPGRFRVVFPVTSAASPPITSDGYVAITLSLVDDSGERSAAEALVVEELGFDTADHVAPDAADPTGLDAEEPHVLRPDPDEYH